MPHFFCKLRPPRTTFISDMTSEEAQLMRAHREYWTPRVETGVVIAMGPVADPSGGYGVAIIEAASEAALEAMQAADPVIGAGPRLCLRKPPHAGDSRAPQPAACAHHLRISIKTIKKDASRRDRNGD